MHITGTVKFCDTLFLSTLPLTDFLTLVSNIFSLSYLTVFVLVSSIVVQGSVKLAESSICKFTTHPPTFMLQYTLHSYVWQMRACNGAKVLTSALSAPSPLHTHHLPPYPPLELTIPPCNYFAAGAAVKGGCLIRRHVDLTCQPGLSQASRGRHKNTHLQSRKSDISQTSWDTPHDML